MKKKTPVKNKFSLAGKIFLGILAFFGALIILVSGLILASFINDANIDTEVLTSSIDDFLTIYDESQHQRDLPDTLSILESTCVIEDNYYTITFTIQNTSSQTELLVCQIYYSDIYADARDGETPTIATVDSDANMTLESMEEKTFTVKGVLDPDDSVEDQLAQLSYIYFECIYDLDVCRIMVPLTQYY